MQRDVNDYGLERTVEQRRNLGLYEIESISNKNGRLLKNFPLMPLPSPDMVRRFGNRLIREKLDYDREKEKDNLDILLSTLNSDQIRVFQWVTHLDERGGKRCVFVYGLSLIHI